MDYTTLQDLRWGGAVVLGAAALVTVFYFALKSPKAGLGVAFVVALWAVGPPVWFFSEYYMIDHDWIRNLPSGGPGGKEALLESVKTYADYASKVWGAVLVAILFLVKKD